MNTNTRSHNAVGIGAVVAMVLCCIGPALVAAGALGAVGGLLGNPGVVVAGAAVAAAAVVAAVRRRQRGDPSCRPAPGPDLADVDEQGTQPEHAARS
jgi:mercuric ion transport protein